MTHFIAWCLLGIIPTIMPLGVIPHRAYQPRTIAEWTRFAESFYEWKRQREPDSQETKQIKVLLDLMKQKQELLERLGIKEFPPHLQPNATYSR